MDAKGERLSRTQLMSVLWLGLLAPVAELLPAVTFPVAGRGAWAAPLLALPGALLAGWLMGTVSRGEGYAAGLSRCLGKTAGKAALLLYLVWGVVLLSLRFRLCAQRLLDAGRRDGSLWFFLVVVAVAAGWMTWGKVAAFGRSAQIMFTTLMITAAVVLGLSLFQVRLENLLPLWTGGVESALRSALPACGVLSYGLYAAFLLGDTNWPAGHGRVYLWWTAAGCILLAASQLVVNGAFGPALTQSLSSPFFSLSKSIGVEGAFQRVESVIAALWVFADLGMAAALLYAIQTIWAALRPGTNLKRVLVTGGAVGLLLAGFLYPDGAAAEEFHSGWGWMISLGLALLIPGACVLVGRGRRGAK